MVESDTYLNTVFHALGDATRRQMLRDLAGGERTVSQLAEPFAISLAAASKHIKALESAGLIRREIRWRTHVCRLNPGPLASAHDWLGFYERFWTDRLSVLDELLRKEGQALPPHRHPKETSTMKDATTIEAYGQLSEPTTLTMQRLLPGPVEPRLGLADRKRAAGEVAGGGRDADERGRRVHPDLAERHADRPARRAPRGDERGEYRRVPGARGRSADPSALRMGRDGRGHAST